MLQPRIGKAMFAGKSPIDPKKLTLTFHYQELKKKKKVWEIVEREQELEAGVHFELDAGRGLITLLEHDFWQKEGLWRAADRKEPLLYKGQVRHPQYIEVVVA